MAPYYENLIFFSPDLGGFSTTKRFGWAAVDKSAGSWVVVDKSNPRYD
jgi:hypothetical protein